MKDITRIISTERDRTLVKVSCSSEQELWVSRYFFDKGFVSLNTIKMKYRRHNYHIQTLKGEFFSENIKQIFRIWDYDGDLFCIFKDGPTYTFKELCEIYEGPAISPHDLFKIHCFKKIFSGTIESRLQKSKMRDTLKIGV